MIANVFVATSSELIATPSLGEGGTNDEDAVDQQQAAGEPS